MKTSGFRGNRAAGIASSCSSRLCCYSLPAPGRKRSSRPLFAITCVVAAACVGGGDSLRADEPGGIRTEADPTRCLSPVAGDWLAAPGDEISGPTSEEATVKHVGPTLETDAAVKLANNDFGIFFPDLVSLDPAAAEALGSAEAFLFFERLEHIDAATAAGLACHRGVLKLDALRKRDPLTARHLAANARQLFLSGITTFDADTARSLASHSGLVVLNGLETLPLDIAAALAHQRGTVSMNGLAKISAAAATEIARLAMNRITSLDDARAAALADHVGWRLSLDSLVRVSDAGLEALRRHPGLSVESLDRTATGATSSSSRAPPTAVALTELGNARWR